MPSELDYYAILGIDERAGEAEVRAAYRRAARSNHPDQNPYDPLAARKFAIVQEAYDVLGDASRRAAYRRPGRPESQAASSNRPIAGPVTAADPPTPSLASELGHVAGTLRVLVRRSHLDRRVRRRIRQVMRYLERL